MGLTPATLIVVPCFNEEERLPEKEFSHFVAEWSDVGFVFVNDGSRDGTQAMLEKMVAQHEGCMWYVGNDQNRGKAAAVRSGVQFCLEIEEWDEVGYWDADLATPLNEIPKFIDLLREQEKVELVMGSRMKRLGADIQRYAWKHYLGRVFATATSMLLDLGVYDTQCGAKLMSRRLAKACFAEEFLSPWLLDVEIIARMKHIYGAESFGHMIHEMPLTCWHDIDGSKIGFFDYLRAPFELWRIGRFYKKG